MRVGIPIKMADPTIVQEMGSKRDPMLSSNNPTRVKIAPGQQVMLQDWQSSHPTVICTCSLLCRADASPLEIIQYVAFICDYAFAYGCAYDNAYVHAFTYTYLCLCFCFCGSPRNHSKYVPLRSPPQYVDGHLRKQ